MSTSRRNRSIVQRHQVASNGEATLADLEAPMTDRQTHRRYGIRVVRTDATKRIVYGEVYVPFDPVEGKVYSVDDINKFVDTWGTFMTRATLEDLAHQFAMWRGYIDRMHDRRTMAGQMVESFIVRDGDPEFTPGAWAMGVKVVDDKVWAEVQAGVLTGFSIDILAARAPHMIQVEGQGEVPDLMGVNQSPFPANDKQVNGSAMLRLDELSDTMPFFVSLVDSAANRREFEKRRAAQNQENDVALKKNPVKAPDPVVPAARTEAAPAVIPPPAEPVVATPAVVTPPVEPIVTPPAEPIVLATPAEPVVEPTVTTPAAPLALVPPVQRYGGGNIATSQPSGPLGEMGSAIDFAAQWNMGDLGEDMCQANWLLSDTLNSIMCLANELSDPQVVFQRIMDTLNQYLAAVRGLLLSTPGAGADEQRKKLILEKRMEVLRALAPNFDKLAAITACNQIARIGKKISAKNQDHLNAAMTHMAEVLKDTMDSGAGADDDVPSTATAAGATGDGAAKQTPVVASEEGKPDPKAPPTDDTAQKPTSTAEPSTVEANTTQTTGALPDDKKPTDNDRGATMNPEDQAKIATVLETLKTLINKVDGLTAMAKGDGPADGKTGTEDGDAQQREGNGLPTATEPNVGNQPSAPQTLPITVDAGAGNVLSPGGGPTLDPKASEGNVLSTGGEATPDPKAGDGNVYSRNKLGKAPLGSMFQPLGFGAALAGDPNKRRSVTSPALPVTFAVQRTAGAPIATPAVAPAPVVATPAAAPAPVVPAQRAAEPVVATPAPSTVDAALAAVLAEVNKIGGRLGDIEKRLTARRSSQQPAPTAAAPAATPAPVTTPAPVARTKDNIFQGALGYAPAPRK